jgi:hypothetical protein
MGNSGVTRHRGEDYDPGDCNRSHYCGGAESF